MKAYLNPSWLVLFCGLLAFSGRTASSAEHWLPRSLGTFHLKDAAFIDAFEVRPDAENYADRYNLYFTTFNAREF